MIICDICGDKMEDDYGMTGFLGSLSEIGINDICPDCVEQLNEKSEELSKRDGYGKKEQELLIVFVKELKELYQIPLRVFAQRKQFRIMSQGCVLNPPAEEKPFFITLRLNKTNEFIKKTGKSPIQVENLIKRQLRNYPDFKWPIK